MEKLLLTQEVADYFRVKPSTVTQKFIKQGLKFFKVGDKDYRYNMRDVLEFEESKKQLDVSTFNNMELAKLKAISIKQKLDGMPKFSKPSKGELVI